MAAITVTDASHSSHLVEEFVSMREAGELFDYVIKGSHESFSIHSLVLASMSPVFKAMLKSTMDESVKKEATFPTILDNIMRKIIHYAYTGTCTFGRDELMSLIRAAHFLAMSKLLKLCEEQITTVLQPSNCFSWLRFADELQLGGVLSQIKQMMFTSHKEVMQSEEFKNTEMSEIAEYMSGLSKKGIHSDTLVEGVLQWIKHDSPNRSVHMTELCECVSIGKCTKPFQYKVVKENAELLETQLNVFRLIVMETLAGDSDENLLILGGQSYSDISNNDCWIVKDDHLVKFAEGPGDQLKPRHSICQVPQGVVLTGGDGSDMCKLFDVANKTWMDKANLLSKRSDHSSGYLRGKVFVIGEWFNNERYEKTVDYMDLEMNTWKHASDIPDIEGFPKVAVCNSMLFVLLTDKGKLYCLDDESASWKQKSGIPISSDGCSMVAVDDRMFVAGGDKNINYMYIPNGDTWCRLTGPSLAEREGSLVSYKQKLYLIAGCKRDRQLTDVEEYDISSDTWSLAAWKLPRPLWLHAAFVVNVPR